VYHVIYETKGYWFRSPEAYEIDGNFRASMYMRPAAIWAMEMTEPRPPAARQREHQRPNSAPVPISRGSCRKIETVVKL
jgi:hypothetical protein